MRLARQPPFAPTLPGLALFAAALCSARPTVALEIAGGARQYQITASAGLSETLTDNGNQSGSAARSDAITQATLNVHGAANAARVKGFVDYSLSGQAYANDTAAGGLQNTLAASATAELVESRAYVESAASISQQLISAFGARTADPALGNANRAEVRSYSLSPYVKGRFAGAVDYQVRLAYQRTSTDVDDGDTSASAATATFGGLTPITSISWSTQFAHNESNYSLGRHTNEDSARATLNFQVTPETLVSANAGVERNNVLTVEKTSYDDYGVGLQWRPSERTSVAVQRDHRYFGDSHAVSLAYRTPRTVWSYTNSRGVVSTPNLPVIGSVGTAFDLLFAQFAAVQPDPVLRRQLVNDFLARNAIDPNRQLLATFLTSALTLQESQQLSFVLLGQRTTYSVSLGESINRRLSAVSLAGAPPTNDDLLTNELVRQRALSVTASHQLTPLSTASLTASYSRNTGSQDTPATSLASVSADWKSRLGARTTVSLGARHSRFTGTNAYHESAVTGSATYTF